MNDKEYAIFVSGYTRQEIEEKYELSIPDEIKQVISDILRQMGSFKFDICTTNMDVIKDNGRIFKADDSISNPVSVGCSNGSIKGVFTVKIKTQPGDDLGFGITSEMSNITKSYWMSFWEGKTYYVYGYQAFQNGEGRIDMKQAFAAGDVVKIQWDDVGNLTYYVNDTEIGIIDIEKGLTYYPCFCRYKGEVDLEII